MKGSFAPLQQLVGRIPCEGRPSRASHHHQTSLCQNLSPSYSSRWMCHPLHGQNRGKRSSSNRSYTTNRHGWGHPIAQPGTEHWPSGQVALQRLFQADCVQSRLSLEVNNVKSQSVPTVVSATLEVTQIKSSHQRCPMQRVRSSHVQWRAVNLSLSQKFFRTWQHHIGACHAILNSSKIKSTEHCYLINYL